MPDVPSLDGAAARARAAVHPVPEPAEDAPEAAPEDTATPPQVIQAMTALMVLQTLDGQTVLADNINLPVVVVRTPTRDEMYGMLATSLKDITVAETSAHAAETTIAMIEAKQQEAQQAFLAAQAKAQDDAVNKGIEQQIAQHGGIRA